MVTAVEAKVRPPEPSRAGLETGRMAGAQPRPAGRATFVLAIFSGEAAAGNAIRRLTTAREQERDAILVSRTDFRESIAARPPFDTLWASLFDRAGAEIHPAARSAEHLAQHLNRRLADGACLVIVRTEEPEQRLAVSRTLFEAGCEVLLTHEATPSGSDTTEKQPRTPVTKP